MTTDSRDFQARATRIEQVLGELESADPSLRARLRELVDLLLSIHGRGLELLLGDVYRRGGRSAVEELTKDELLNHLLVLHGLHPDSAEERVREALVGVRPYLASHGGNVELMEVNDEGRVLLRLQGSCDGCPSSSATLKYAIEEAVYAAAPEIAGIEVVDGEPDAEGFIPMSEVLWEDCPFPETQPAS